MTQDQPQTPEPNQPQPPEPPAVSPAEEMGADTTGDATLTDAALAEEALETSQIQSTDSRSEASVAAVEVSATEEPIETPVSPLAASDSAPSVNVPAVTKPEGNQVAESHPSAPETRSAPATKAAALFRLIGQLWGIVLPLLILVARWAWQVTLVTLKGIREAWKVLLPKIRALLPEGWRKLPDWALTTVAVTLLVFILWLTAQLLSPRNAPTTAIDRTPPALNAPAPEQPAQPVPNSDQIAKIQEQVAEVTDQYAEGLIQAVQANFQEDLLTVRLGDTWFNLDTASQGQLANELLRRSRKLDFDVLELTDPTGELLARSPVVGSKMVVYGMIKDEG